MYYQFIYRVTVENPNLQIVIVAGNHDSAARLEAPLPLLQAMRTEVRGVVRKLEGGEIDYDHLIVELKNRKGEVELLCMAVPFLRQGDYPVVQTEGNLYAEGVRELYSQLLQRLWKQRTANQSILAIGHFYVNHICNKKTRGRCSVVAAPSFWAKCLIAIIAVLCYTFSYRYQRAITLHFLNGIPPVNPKFYFMRVELNSSLMCPESVQRKYNAFYRLIIYDTMKTDSRGNRLLCTMYIWSGKGDSMETDNWACRGESRYCFEYSLW